MADRTKELQLDHDLQMTELQEALCETQSQSGTHTCTLNGIASIKMIR